MPTTHLPTQRPIRRGPSAAPSQRRARITLLVVDPAATELATVHLRPLAVALVVPPWLSRSARLLWPRVPVDERALTRERAAWNRDHADPARASG
jgi:hypothetical protein